ncbi:proton-conducting transporter transmembrane domain-containing protein [Pyrobaculum aerophilum]|uniref:NADH:quinone oxidoreductase/Mrp antiporter transmembrane domain-containing protein n=1 Tax=Pyrobaculum aerophilum TaxID=13773 RepID=A0A371R2G0_9CREN|nr:proton-conducting transporter membrane subunit [Pyrobaculum aerophilum]RFA97686.1 hypothetical protein CGL51_02095 [Pyrobaculum aerophilum]RFA99498.1 hypothetical protein CGL52_02860 [Pyrobaculum aerophilum]
MALEIWLLVTVALALLDLFTKRGFGSVIAGGATLYLVGTHSLEPATSLLRLDGFARHLFVFISGVYTAIAVYSMWYSRHIERRGWFWMWMGVFYASMLLFVASDHWLLLILGWGGLDLASWALILTYRDEEDMGKVGLGGRAWGINWEWAPSTSALRAILTVEVGTAALITALATVGASSPYISKWTALPDAAAWLVLLAAFVKSAQLPFTEWLMTAMSAPTPVSALLHSSTMVKAGPILLLKLSHAMPQWAWAPAFVIGIATALYGGLVALGQREPKVLLASSTASYLGLLTAFALKNPEEALWLLYAHGVAKATLFMAVGHGILTNHSRTPDSYPIAAKAAMALALLTLVGLTPLGAMAKAHAELWLLLFSLLTAGYVGKLLLKSSTTQGGWAVATPYLALVLSSFAVFTLPNVFWALALAGLALAKTPEYSPLYRRLGLPVLFDLIAPRVFKAIARAVAVVDNYTDRRLTQLGDVWISITQLIASVDKAVDLFLHDLVPTLTRHASMQISKRSFDYFLYVLGVGSAVILALVLLVWSY